MARKILKSRIHANERRRATALFSIPFILLLFGLLFVLMTQGVAVYSAPPSGGGALPPEGPLQNGTFDLQVSKTDGVHYVTPGTVITYTIYYTNAGSAPSDSFHVIECPPSDATVQGGANPGWTYVAPCYWRYPATDISLEGGESGNITFTVTVPVTVSYGTQLDNRVTFSEEDETPETQADNSYTDTDIVVPGFNFSYLPLVTKTYAP